VEFLTEHLADVSRAFGGDLQEMLVLAIIGQKQLRSAINQQGAETAISASRIADVTGIPRQTVRRKLKSLEARGWITQTPDAAYKLAILAGGSPAKSDLNDVDRRAIERVARLYLNLTRVLASPDPTRD
jgi:predicted transcriptional regulator of viral defense system